MHRPNLARAPFQNTRPVWLTGIVLTVVAVVFTTLSITEALGARSSERQQAERLRSLTARRAELAKQVDAANRELSRVAWKKLQTETTSLQSIVARRQLSWSLLIVDLEKVLPWDVRLISIDPHVQENGSIALNLKGVATTRDAWLHLLTVFFGADRFSDPVPVSEETPAGGAQGYSFVVKVSYWPGGRPS
jgi:hypothetical protein